MRIGALAACLHKPRILLVLPTRHPLSHHPLTWWLPRSHLLFLPFSEDPAYVFKGFRVPSELHHYFFAFSCRELQGLGSWGGAYAEHEVKGVVKGCLLRGVDLQEYETRKICDIEEFPEFECFWTVVWQGEPRHVFDVSFEFFEVSVGTHIHNF